MKALITLFFVTTAFLATSQDQVQVFESSKLKLNNQGESIEQSTETPTIITIDLDAKNLNITSPSEEVNKLLKGETNLKIDKQMGQMREQYSLQLNEFILAHFYLDMNVIILTRSDVHPLKWGIQFQETSRQ
ncbi:MAG: hypothetical protein WEC59_06900 [Salibacteraceae bacterium]